MLWQVSGIPICLGTDALDLERRTMVRFVAPVTMLATGGLGQVTPASCCIYLQGLPCKQPTAAAAQSLQLHSSAP